VVQHGDTLSNIADKHGISLSQIEALNPQLKDPNLIYAGQVVNVGDASKAAASSAIGAAPVSQDSFPTSSTYPTTGQSNATTASSVTPQAKHGWGGDPATSPDPAQTATYVDAHQNTDPLQIKDRKSTT
jgi:hypothetical protein